MFLIIQTLVIRTRGPSRNGSKALLWFSSLVPTLDWLWLPAVELSRKKCCDRLVMSALGVGMSFDSRA